MLLPMLVGVQTESKGGTLTNRVKTATWGRGGDQMDTQTQGKRGYTLAQGAAAQRARFARVRARQGRAVAQAARKRNGQ